jgi:O-antigen/teichoic acid export membrane protein
MARTLEDPPAAAMAPVSSLRSLALRGSVWTVLGFGGSQVLRLAGNLVLTRLLFPEAFGMMALVSVFMTGLELFSDIGIGLSIIQNKRGDDTSFLNTAWTIQVFRGFALTAVAAAFAYPVAVGWFRKPELVPLILVAGCISIVMGFNSTKLFSANRHMVFGRLTVLDIGTQIITLVLTISIAFWLRSVWSLVIANLIGAAVRMAASHLTLSGPSNRLCLDRAVCRELFRFGRWIFLSTLMSFAAGQGDRILLGRYVDDTVLGVYNIAFFLSDALTRVISTVSNKVLFPSYCRLAHDDLGRLRRAFLRSRGWLMFGMLPWAGLICGAAPSLIRLLYDSRYSQAAWMLRILMIRVVLGIMYTPAVSLLIAIGKPQFNTFGLSLKTVWLFVGLPVAYAYAGMAGAVWVIGLNELLTVLVLVVALLRFGMFDARQDALGLATVCVSFLAGSALNSLVS